MKPIFLKIVAAMIGSLLVASVAFFFWASGAGRPQEQYAEIIDGKGESPPVSKDTFTVISYNIGYLSGLTNNQAVERTQLLFDQNQKTAIAALSDLQADFIGFQEIDIAAKRSFQVNQVEALTKALGFGSAAIAINWDKNYLPFPYWPPSVHFGRIVSGQAVLSRYPIQFNQRIVLEKVKDHPFFYSAFYLDRIAQVTQIDLNGKTLVLINCHLESFDSPTRTQQTQTVLKLAETYATDYPVLLIGDFNSDLNREEEGADRSINLILQSERLRSAIPRAQLEAGAMATFPSDAPQYRLDYIFYSFDTIEPIDWRVVDEAAQASDHLPVMMRFRVK
ncbi:MAG: endonuclease/exonuclease/phosphatase family protein [Leptolyngbyaceae cyanobacterium MO_188.B28]|nr:endonuclease/exonuclease/phosphatase family protein [Leptolyngbyaceae cyanobacterium MO_188.B28]